MFETLRTMAPWSPDTCECSVSWEMVKSSLPFRLNSVKCMKGLNSISNPSINIHFHLPESGRTSGRLLIFYCYHSVLYCRLKWNFDVKVTVCLRKIDRTLFQISMPLFCFDEETRAHSLVAIFWVLREWTFIKSN